VPRPKAWIAWSSGKDSAWALYAARQAGDLDVTGLLTTVTQPFNRVSMHGVRAALLEAQARALGLPLRRVDIPYPCSNAQYEAAMSQAMDDARGAGVTRMVFGDLYLEDVRAYREQKLAGTGVTPVFPLWGRDTRGLAREMIAGGLKAFVVCLDPKRVPRTLAGRAFDEEFLAALPPEADPCAERGEFHTVACGGPMFAAEIPTRLGETVERDGFVFTDVIPLD
jgi:uncharacterized protein (TIGR00290 family)